MTAVPGDIIAGKYAIVKVLGEGGMGIVFEATHVKLRQRVAIKMLQPDMLGNAILLTRFEREARAAAQLRNRHTARVMDVDVTPEALPYIVMELLEGHDLNVELGRRKQLSHEEAVDYVLQACSAMIEAHQHGIVHRDLKPANLFLAVDNDERIIKVLDFGVSKVAESDADAKLTSRDSVMGTAHYMSPEQIHASGDVDGRSDIWALGIILYELLAGRPPWTGTPTQLAAAIVTEDPPDLRTLCQVPVEIAAVIAKALQRDPDHRFASVRELALALAPFAPASGAGRVIADGLRSGSGVSGAHPRVTVRPRLEDAQTLLQAPPVTAPGWSQHNAPKPRNRSVVLAGFLFAFAGGLIVIGVIAWLGVRADAAKDRVTASSITAPPTASSAPTAPAPVPVPLAVTVASEMPPVTSAAPSALRAPPVRTKVGPIAPSGKGAGPAPPSIKPAPAPSGNPLLL